MGRSPAEVKQMLAPIPKRHHERALDLKQAQFKSALDILLLAGEDKASAVAQARECVGLANPAVPAAFW